SPQRSLPTRCGSCSSDSPRFGKRSRSMNGSRLGKALANGAKAGLFLGLAGALLILAVAVAVDTQQPFVAIGLANGWLVRSQRLLHGFALSLMSTSAKTAMAPTLSGEAFTS